MTAAVMTPPVLATDGELHCGERSPEGKGARCTRPKGHKGGHLDGANGKYWQTALPHCGARWPNRGPAGGRWTCTLDEDHDGDHEAGGHGIGRPFSRASQGDDEITWDAS